MKKSELVKLIREEARKEAIKITKALMKKEVEKQIKEIFIKEGVKSLFSESNTSSSNLSDMNIREHHEVPNTLPLEDAVDVEQVEKNFVSDPVLNKILNETANSSPPIGKEEYPTMGGGFTVNKMEEIMGVQNGFSANDPQTKRDMSAAKTIMDAGADVKELPEEVTNALTKDYSALMKKVVAKEKQSGRVSR